MTMHIIRRPVEESLLLPGLHPVLAKIYAARNITSSDQLQHSFQHLLSYRGLSGINDAVNVLATALRNEKRILVIGDFDADGATSSALAIRALRWLGAMDVNYLVPNRFEYGYGLTPEIVQVAAQRQPDLIITVDNGISSIEGVQVARTLGIDVLVTDHHLPGSELPAANAIVNPNQPGDLFPSKNLAGVGVIFYVMLALRAHLREREWFSRRNIKEPNLANLLDLVALGTVADVVPLDHNNRILVAQGLARIQKGQCCAGIKALIEISGRRQDQLVAADLGFALGPRINAAGRLEDMSLGIECLLYDDPVSAQQTAQRLEELNLERREIEGQMKEQAMAGIRKMRLDEAREDLPVGLCLYDPDWHQGVIGILASRVKERLHRPVIAFAPASDQDLKGSARSIPGLHIRDTLDAIAARYPNLLTKFGGHAMAAGLQLKHECLATFSAAFDEEVRRHLNMDDLKGIINSDGALSAEELDLEVAWLLRRSGPWGQAFPEPVFDGTFTLINRRIVGERHLKMLLQPPESSRLIDAIAFNTSDAHWPDQVNQIHAAYRLDINEYQNRQNTQLIIEYIEPL
jgi:single-stranded-DNA-specific exonuclease